MKLPVLIAIFYAAAALAQPGPPGGPGGGGNGGDGIWRRNAYWE